MSYIKGLKPIAKAFMFLLALFLFSLVFYDPASAFLKAIFLIFVMLCATLACLICRSALLISLEVVLLAFSIVFYLLGFDVVWVYFYLLTLLSLIFSFALIKSDLDKYFFLVLSVYAIFSSLVIIINLLLGRGFNGSYEPGFSINYILVFLVLIVFCYIVSCKCKLNFISIFLLSTLIFLSWLLDSRANLLLLLVSVICLVGYRIFSTTLSVDVWRFFLVILCCFFSFLYIYLLFHDVRYYLYRDFLECFDFLDMALGFDYAEMSCGLISERFSNNPHSSVIRAYEFYGVFGAIVFLFLVFGVFVRAFLLNEKSFFIVLILTFFALIRSLSDSIFLPFYFDLLFWYLVSVSFSWKTCRIVNAEPIRTRRL